MTCYFVCPVCGKEEEARQLSRMASGRLYPGVEDAFIAPAGWYRTLHQIARGDSVEYEVSCSEECANLLIEERRKGKVENRTPRVIEESA